MPVSDLATHIGKPAPLVPQQHLAKLRMARLVRTRREGTTIFYFLEKRPRPAVSHRRRLQRRTRKTGVPGDHRDAAELAVLHSDQMHSPFQWLTNPG